MHVVLGLGNPGTAYASTRHNAGFLLAEALVEHWGLRPFRRGWRVRISKGDVDGRPVVVVKPKTYMNRSGYALRRFLSKPDFDPSRELLILVDDAALPIGTFRVRGSGSSGGHNGLKSVQGALRSTDYARLRIGVGPVPEHIDDRSDFVLGDFEDRERELLEARIPTMLDAIECWLEFGAEEAMNRFNKLGKEQ